MELGEVVVTHVNYNFTTFHQNQMKNKKSFTNSPFFCSEFQSVSIIMKIVHSVCSCLFTSGWSWSWSWIFFLDRFHFGRSFPTLSWTTGISTSSRIWLSIGYVNFNSSSRRNFDFRFRTINFDSSRGYSALKILLNINFDLKEYIDKIIIL